MIKKKQLVLIIVVILLLLTAFVVYKLVINKEALFKNIINVNDISELKRVEIVENNEIKIASKYKIESNKIYETKETIKLDDIEGKIIFVRGETLNANIYQVEFAENKNIEDIPLLVQIDQYMKSFTDKVFRELKIPYNLVLSEENIYGKVVYKFDIPIEEKIYKYKLLYSKTYIYNNIKYDFNYYMNDNKLICESVKILQ